MSTHRYHHQFVDTEQDPHTPIHGFWFGYIIWILEEKDGSIAGMNRKHRKLDNASDLEKQIFYRFIRKTYLLHPIALAIILYVIGGFPFFIWGTVRNI